MIFNKTFPSVVKYMGSKTEVLDLIEEGINYLNRDYEYICDLFAGSATLSGALRGHANVISNDVQQYSQVFSKTYLNNYDWSKYPNCDPVCELAADRVKRFYEAFPEYKNRFNYDRDFTVDELNEYEEQQRSLINKNDWAGFDDYYLFTKDYSGTYWSFDQCVWIDSYKYAIDTYKKDDAYYNLLISCLVYAMAYNSQSTGHYAQYRIPDKESSKEDILIYRRKNITSFFRSKYAELKTFTKEENKYTFEVMAETDIKCIQRTPNRSLIYADPPYCFVHYSRFYHILETLVRYDYPELKYKGRYRTDRYQSEYCIRTEVANAFTNMFSEMRDREQDMILSYSNSKTNTIDYKELVEIACEVFAKDITEEQLSGMKGKIARFLDDDTRVCKLIDTEEMNNQPYEISFLKKPYNHSRMGRTNSKTIPVTELIIVAKHIH